MLYRITYKIDSKETGLIFPQVKGVYKPLENPVYPYPDVEPKGILLDEVEFPVYELKKRAKQSDLLSNVSLGGDYLMISKKAKEVLKDFKMLPHRFYPLKIIVRDELVDNYEAFYISRYKSYKQEYFQMDKMEFIYLNREPLQIIDPQVGFKSYKEYTIHQKKADKLNHFYAPKEIMDDIPFDIIKMGTRFMHPGYYCNEKVKDAIISNGLTGFKIEEITNTAFEFFFGKYSLYQMKKQS